MKTINIKSYFYAVVLAGIVMMAFNACKKQDVKNDSLQTQSEKETLEKVKNAILSRVGENTATIILNTPATDVYYADANNNRIDMRQYMQNYQSNPFAYSPMCVPPIDGNGDPEPGMQPSNFILNSTGFVVDCGGGTNYKVSFKWSVAVRQLLQVSNNFGTGGATLRSRYRLEIKNSAGTIIATYNPNFVLAQDIRDKGDLPADPTRKLYEIFATINVPSSIFTAGTTWVTTLTMATNCNQLPQIFNTFTSTSGSSLNTQPCIRTDKVWVTPGTGVGGIANAAGTFITCAVPPGYTTCGTHELEFRARNVATTDAWDAQTSTIKVPSIVGASTANGNPFGTSTGVVDLDGMVTGSGVWLVRYRNKGTCATPGPWLVEKWTL